MGYLFLQKQKIINNKYGLDKTVIITFKIRNKKKWNTKFKVLIKKWRKIKWVKAEENQKN